MDQHSIDRLAKVHPRLAAQIPLVIEDLNKQVQHNQRWEVGQGLRTFAEQDKLYHQRPRVTKAPAGLSNHNYGLAVDLVLFTNDKPDWTPASDHLYNLIGVPTRAHGLSWGGDWRSFVDRPHIELHGSPSVHECLAIYKGAGNNLAAVWARIK